MSAEQIELADILSCTISDDNDILDLFRDSISEEDEACGEEEGAVDEEESAYEEENIRKGGGAGAAPVIFSPQGYPNELLSPEQTTGSPKPQRHKDRLTSVS